MLFRQIMNSTDVSRNKDGFTKEIEGAINQTSTIDITPESAFSTIGTVFECVAIRANSLGKLPLQLYKKTKQGRERDNKHSLWYLLEKRPNKYQTPSQFKSYLEVSRLLWGNAYIYLETDRTGKIISLLPLDPASVTLEKNNNGDYIYKYVDDKGTEYIYLEDEVVHLPYVSMDGKLGKAPLEVARENASNLQYISQFEGNFYKNGTLTSGVLESPGLLDGPAKDKIRKEWQKLYGGVKNGGSIAVLDAGFNYKPITIPLKDVEFIASRKMNKLDIATIFGIPSFMLNDLDNAKFNNIEHQYMRFLSDVLQPTCTMLEEELNYKLFTENESKNYYVKFNLNASMRIDSKTRAEYYKSMIEIGVFSIDDVRELEDYDSIGEMGSKHFISLNYTTLDTIEQHNRLKGGDNNE